MKSLPDRPDLRQLKSQAKELLAAYSRDEPNAARRFRESLPAVAGCDPEAIKALGLRLHDAQSCIAREYGFASWADLRSYVNIVRARETDPAALLNGILQVVYSGCLVEGPGRAKPKMAARLVERHPDLPRSDPWIALATGEVDVIHRQIEANTDWANNPGGPLGLTPLISACHSALVTLPEYRDRIHRTVDLLLKAGADPNLRITKRSEFAADGPAENWHVSALYGAAGVTFDRHVTRLLLQAGADPNDGESLYHSLDNPKCTALLLEAGAVVAGTNALHRCLDRDDLETFKLLLAHSERTEELKDGRLLLWAIRRRRSVAHVEALIAMGTDTKVKTPDGVSAYLQALRYGLTEVANLLEREGASEALVDEDRLLAACTSGDAGEARRIIVGLSDLPDALGDTRLQMLPELAALGCREAAVLMVDLGWPIDVPGGDWGASALNQAVFRGDAVLARHLLERGASWTEKHGYGDNVCGTLSWASINQPEPDGDWLACADALVAHGMPLAERSPTKPEEILVAGQSRQFSEEVTAFLLAK